MKGGVRRAEGKMKNEEVKEEKKKGKMQERNEYRDEQE